MIRFGLIGCGAISRTHAEAILINNGSLVACCDLDPVAGENFAQDYHCRFYQDYRELLQDPTVEVVVIATPHYLHKPMSIAALQANKHVLCEKPMATTIQDAKEVCRVIKETEKIYCVCYQNRFNPSFRKLKQLLAAEDYGLLRGVKCNVTWHRDASYYADSPWKGTWEKEGGGVLINQAIHTIDAVCNLIGQPTKIKGKILTSLLDERIEVEDAALGTGILAPNIPFVIHASNNYSSDPSPEIVFDFEKVVIKLTNKSLYLDDQAIELTEEKVSSVAKDYWGNGHSRLYQTFKNKLQGIADPTEKLLSSQDAYASLAVVCGIYESDKQNQWIVIN